MNRKIIFRNFKKNIVTFLFIFLVVAGKIVRYTIMKETLVDPGIGHSMITIINNQETTFGFNLALALMKQLMLLIMQFIFLVLLIFWDSILMKNSKYL